MIEPHGRLNLALQTFFGDFYGKVISSIPPCSRDTGIVVICSYRDDNDKGSEPASKEGHKVCCESDKYDDASVVIP